jgi:DNA-binding GntR family transcriptional regulator
MRCRRAAAHARRIRRPAAGPAAAEGKAAERGTLRLSDTDRARLAVLRRKMCAAVGAADAKVYLDTNEDIHRVLCGVAGSPTLMLLVETLCLMIRSTGRSKTASSACSSPKKRSKMSLATAFWPAGFLSFSKPVPT